MKKLLYLFLTVLMVACSGDINSDGVESGETETNPSKPNILLIIADDMGKDATVGFSEGIIKPNTPNINSIRNEGISFNNFWVYPTCSPTRASIITGKYGFENKWKFFLRRCHL